MYLIVCRSVVQICMVGRKLVEHNMGAGRHKKRDEQFCRPAPTIGPPIVAAAFLHRAEADLLISLTDVSARIGRLKTQLRKSHT